MDAGKIAYWFLFGSMVLIAILFLLGIIEIATTGEELRLDKENQISEIIYKSDLTQPEKIEIILSMCDTEQCKIDMMRKHVMVR